MKRIKKNSYFKLFSVGAPQPELDTKTKSMKPNWYPDRHWADQSGMLKSLTVIWREEGIDCISKSLFSSE